jgi:hypothetical protein
VISDIKARFEELQKTLDERRTELQKQLTDISSELMKQMSSESEALKNGLEEHIIQISAIESILASDDVTIMSQAAVMSKSIQDIIENERKRPPAYSGNCDMAVSFYSAQPITANQPMNVYRTIYGYISNDPEELTFVKGQDVIIYQQDGDWWWGEIDNRQGYIPANHLELVTPDLNSSLKDFEELIAEEGSLDIVERDVPSVLSKPAVMERQNSPRSIYTVRKSLPPTPVRPQDKK